MLAPSSLGALTHQEVARHRGDDIEVAEEPAAHPRPRARRALVAGATAVALLATAAIATTGPDGSPATEAPVPAAMGAGVVSVRALGSLPTRTVWTAQVEPGEPTTAVQVGEQIVIEQTLGGPLVGRDARTGEIRWVRPVADPLAHAIVGDTIIVSPEGALDASTGRVRWRRDGGQPTVVDAHTLVYSEGRSIEAVALESGEARWRSDVVNDAGDPLLVQYVMPGTDPLLVVATAPRGDGTRTLLAFDRDRGDRLWERTLTRGAEERHGPLHAAGPYSVHVEGGRYVVRGPDGEDSGASIPIRGSMDESGRFPRAVVAPHPADARRWLLAVEPAADEADLTVFDDAGQARWRWRHRESVRDVIVMGSADGAFLLDVPTTHDLAQPDGATATTVRRHRLRLDVLTGEESRTFAPAATTERVSSLRDHAVPATVDTVDGDLRVRFHDAPVAWTQPFANEPGGGVTALGVRVFIPTKTGVRVVASPDGRVLADLVLAPREPGHHVFEEHRLRAPAAANGVLVVPPPPGRRALTAFDLATFTTRWETSTRSTQELGRALATDGEVVFTTTSREIHGYDLETGERTLRVRTNGDLDSLAVTATHLAATVTPPSWHEVAEQRREVAVVDRATSDLAWAVPEPGVCTAPTILEEPGAVLAGNLDGLTSYDLATGERRWHLGDLGPVCLDVAVAGGLVIVAPTGDVGPTVTDDPVGRHVRALDPVDGETVWRTGFDAPVAVAPVVAGDQVLVALVDGTILALDAADGTITSRTSVDGVPASPPAVADDGTLIVMTTDGQVTALR